MRLRFEAFTGDDDDAFSATRDSLLEEFYAWLNDRDDVDDANEAAADAGVFLDWRYRYSSGELDRYHDGDIAEFLVEWCPRKVSAPPSAAAGFAAAVGLFATFLADTGRLVGGADRADRLRALTAELAPEAERAMSDPRTFGMAKSMLGSLDLSDVDDPDDLQAALDAKIAEFNARPVAERMAVTDPGRSPHARPQVVLPYVHVPMSASQLAAAAADVRGLWRIEQLRSYLGADGRAITAKGNIKLADGRALVDLLETGDVVDPTLGDVTTKTTSTTELGGLNVVVELGKRLDAVRVLGGKLVPVETWAGLDPVDKAVRAAETAIEVGPLTLRSAGAGPPVSAVLDAGVVHMLAVVLSVGAAEPATLLDLASEIVERSPRTARMFRPMDDSSRTVVAIFLEELFEVLEDLNVVGRTEDSDIGLTALGAHVVAALAPRYGIRFETLDDLADADAAALLAALADPRVDSDAAFASWQPARSADERARLLAEATATTTVGAHRSVGIGLLGEFDVAVAEPHVRGLLDTPAAGHAALWLMAHGIEHEQSVGHYLGIGVLVDTLSAAVDHPDILIRMFTQHDDAERSVDEMWRHDAPETALVLDVIGRHHPDRRLAKAARKALFRHRSWMASRTN